MLGYAIGYAEDGHELLPRVAATIATVADLFREHWPTSAALWMPDGVPPEAGTVVRLPQYAATLRRLVDAGREAETRESRIDAAREAWGSGFVADAVEAFARTPHRHSTGTDHAGVITASDMAAWSASYEPALTLDFHGVTVAKTGPWGQGPVLLQSLAILAGYAPHEIDPSTADGAHRVLEALKLALADRDAHYGDPESLVRSAGDAALAGVRRGPEGPDRRPGCLARVPTGRPRRGAGLPAPAGDRPRRRSRRR